MRTFLMVVLGLGVVFGFSSGFASLRFWLHHGGCHGDWREGRWEQGRGDGRRARAEVRAQAPAPQTVVVQPPAVTQGGAPAPQVFVIMPQGTMPAPQVVGLSGASGQFIAAPAAPAPVSGTAAPSAHAP